MPIKRKAKSFVANVVSARVTNEEKLLYFHCVEGASPGMNGGESV